MTPEPPPHTVVVDRNGHAGRQHGTHACYVFGPAPGAGKGCRCEPCRQANRTYEAERARRVTPSYVDANPARAHIEHLATMGVGLKTIARRSGVSHGALHKLVYGAPGRGPSKRIRKATEDAILAVMPADAADGARIPAGPTWDHVHELLRRGWTKTAIGHAIGQGGVLQLSRTTVTAGNARAIKALLDEPVPPRRTRWGTTVEPTWDPDTEARDAARRQAQAEVRSMYRAAARGTNATSRDLLGTIDEGDTDWMMRGACRHDNTPTWLFFPAPTDRETIRRAKAVCATCPVTADCLAHGDRLDADGIWGGLTEVERRRTTRRVAS